MPMVKDYVGQHVTFECDDATLYGEVISSTGTWLRILVQVSHGLEEEFEVHVSAVKAD